MATVLQMFDFTEISRKFCQEFQEFQLSWQKDQEKGERLAALKPKS